MSAPTDVARFHAEYDRHPDDRVRLFRAVTEVVSRDARVLYPGSYIDIGPSVWFEDVTYIDIDKRAAHFFKRSDAVLDLIKTKRRSVRNSVSQPITTTFHHLDYATPLPLDDHSVDLLLSLYAGFISESCTRYLKPGGTLVVNDSHGDASMATLDPGYSLVGVITSRQGEYRITTDDLASYLQPKRGLPPTRDALHSTGRGIAYTRSPFAYVFRIG